MIMDAASPARPRAAHSSLPRDQPAENHRACTRASVRSVAQQQPGENSEQPGIEPGASLPMAAPRARAAPPLLPARPHYYYHFIPTIISSAPAVPRAAAVPRARGGVSVGFAVVGLGLGGERAAGRRRLDRSRRAGRASAQDRTLRAADVGNAAQRDTPHDVRRTTRRANTAPHLGGSAPTREAACREAPAQTPASIIRF